MFLSRHLVVQVSLVAVVCTMIACLLSAPVGPYSVVHGPVTALRALRASILLFWSIVVAAFIPILMPRLCCTEWACSSTSKEQLVLAGLQLSAVLRC